ncbi:MAG TPA: hypothetical protein VHD88_02470 [Pyrinomonadaceae bacterium]|nr:hypothetical protein [Pyrinomonadaceae bacterium]
MSTNVLVSNRAMTSVLAGPQVIPHSIINDADNAFVLEVDVPRFRFHNSSPIVDFIPAGTSGDAIARIEIDSGVKAVLTLTGHPMNGGDFQVEQVGLKMETTVSRARADFIACSFTAMLGLAGQVRLEIPDAAFKLIANFESDLLEVSKMLERRQVAFRIMMIECATGFQFDLPKELTGDEVESIALIYHAIVHRSFVWPIPSIKIFVPATAEMLAHFRRLSQLNSISLGPDPQDVTLFDQRVSLGEGMVTIDDSLIDDWTRIEQELGQNDGHTVTVVIRSTSHKGKYHLLNAPRLPISPWDSTVQRFVEIDDELDAYLAKGYNNLAIATLEGLDENQKVEMTTRPSLDGNAFQLS